LKNKKKDKYERKKINGGRERTERKNIIKERKIKSDSHDQPSIFLFASAHGFPSLPDCSFVLLFTPFLACYMHPCFYFYFLISYLIVPFIQISSKFIYLCVMSILCLMLNNIKIQKKYTMSFYLSFFLICQKIQKIYYV
jgi:hypothetical protein